MERQLVELLGARYRLGKLLGRGGMGAVYRATDTMLDREVAIKVIPPELARMPEIVSRFEREARTAAKLDHPGIIPIYAVERGQDISLFIMKFVNGRDLEAVMATEAKLPIDFCQRVIWEAACALGHAHQRGVVHRDIKPANIMLDEADRVLVADFGIAKANEAMTQLTSTGTVLGTPQYMSPEQAMGEMVSGASDQYSLGMTAYHLIAGQPAFSMTSIHGLIYKHIHEVPPSLKELRAEVPDHMAQAVARALAKDPAERFPTMEDFATALWPERPVAAGAVSMFSTSTALPASTPTGKRPATVPLLIGAIAIVAVGIGASQLLGGGADPGAATTELGTATVPTVETSTPAPAAPPTAAPTTPLSAPATTPRPDTSRRAAQAPPPATASPPASEAKGFITVGADPFGMVYIDGVELQDTPVTNYPVTPGRHVIEIRRMGYRTTVDTIDVAAGGKPRLSKKLVELPR